MGVLYTLAWILCPGISAATPLPSVETVSHGAADAAKHSPAMPAEPTDGSFEKFLGHSDQPPRLDDMPFAPPKDSNLGRHILPPLDGFAYPVDNPRLMRGFDGAGCYHQGVDIGAYGPHGGVGKAVYAITRSEITFIGTPEKSSRRYGRRDRRAGTVKRGGYQVPRRMTVDGYGTVYPVTRNLGAARTGVFLVTKALHPLMEGYDVRYMHFAALRPDLKVGDIVEAGEEIGIMGSTAILESAPHMHIDVEDLRKVRVDVAPYIGLNQLLSSKCRPRNKSAWAKRRAHRRRRGH